MPPRSWTRVYVEELSGDEPRKGPTTVPRRRKIHTVLTRQRVPHVGPNLDRDQPFSWSRCLISLVSYALLLSDVLRAGLGVRKVASDQLYAFKPDTFFFVGPASYSANHLTQHNATADTSAGFWLYKYDTTSTTMRAFAEHLRLTTWSPCVLYRQSCDESVGLTPRTIFTMVDSLVDAVAISTTAAQPTRPPRPLTLRIESEMRDRLHHYALPMFFERKLRRTAQAIHYQYPYTSLNGTTVSATATVSSSLCSGSFHHQRPLSCGEIWTKWRNREPVVSIWEHIPTRLAALAATYPNHTIDFVVLDGTEDFSRGSLTYQGRKFLDVVVFSRIQQCTDAQICTTVAVDDYRYEAAVTLVNVGSWYGVVSSLRLVGQTYTWLRALMLISICTLARHQQQSSRGLLKEFTTTVRTVFLIPSQVVVYGSSFPIGLYTIAHLTDSPAVYELVSTLFYSLFGRFSWSATDFIRHCAVSMRTVWLLSLLCHLAVMASTRCRWSPSQGIPGIPEFLISFTAMFTIFAQYRSIRLRSVRVLQVQEVIPSLRTHQIRGHTHDSIRSILSDLFFGSTIDAQCLISTALAMCCLTTLLWLLNRISPKWFPYRITLCSRTLVPYSAGSLWPQSRLVVSWFGSIFERDALATETFDRVASHAPNISMITFPSLGTNNNRLPRALRSSPEKGLVMRTTTASRQIQREMQSLDKRSREIESMVYLVNLAVMTDPISFLQLRIFSGCRVAVYESKLTQRCFLLPHGLRYSDADIPIDWDELELLAVINTKDLEWCDLLRCG